MRGPAVPQDSRNTTQSDVRRLASDPIFQRGLKVVAVGAAVPEKVYDLDPGAGFDGLRWLDQAVLDVLAGPHVLSPRPAGQGNHRQRLDTEEKNQPSAVHGGISYFPARGFSRA